MYEGDTVTVLGTLKFDPALDAFEVTNPIALWRGSSREYYNFYKEQVRLMNNDSTFLKIMGLFFIGMAGTYTYIVYRAHKRANQHLLRDQQI